MTLPKLITCAYKLKDPWKLASMTFIGQSTEDYESQNHIEGITFSEGGYLMEIRSYKQISPAEYPVEPHVHYKPKRDWIETTLYCVLAFCLFGAAFSLFKAMQIALSSGPTP
jgi:hypothetical protein